LYSQIFQQPNEHLKIKIKKTEDELNEKKN